MNKKEVIPSTILSTPRKRSRGAADERTSEFKAELDEKQPSPMCTPVGSGLDESFLSHCHLNEQLYDLIIKEKAVSCTEAAFHKFMDQTLHLKLSALDALEKRQHTESELLEHKTVAAAKESNKRVCSLGSAIKSETFHIAEELEKQKIELRQMLYRQETWLAQSTVFSLQQPPVPNFGDTSAANQDHHAHQRTSVGALAYLAPVFGTPNRNQYGGVPLTFGSGPAPGSFSAAPVPGPSLFTTTGGGFTFGQATASNANPAYQQMPVDARDSNQSSATTFGSGPAPGSFGAAAVPGPALFTTTGGGFTFGQAVAEPTTASGNPVNEPMEVDAADWSQSSASTFGSGPTPGIFSAAPVPGPVLFTTTGGGFTFGQAVAATTAASGNQGDEPMAIDDLDPAGNSSQQPSPYSEFSESSKRSRNK